RARRGSSPPSLPAALPICTLAVTDSLLAANATYGHGGALYNHGTAALTNATLYGNYADTGGAVFNAASDLIITQSTITGNKATTDRKTTRLNPSHLGSSYA